MGRPVVEGIKNNSGGNTMKTGWKTTEFWMTLLTQVACGVSAIAGADSKISIIVGAVVTAVYSISRGITKSNQ